MSVLELAQPIVDAAQHAVAIAEPLRGWTPPDTTPKAPPGSGGLLLFLSWVKWVALIIGVVGLMFVGITFLISKGRGEGHEIGPVLMKWMLGITIVGSAGLIVGLVTQAMGF